MSDDNAIFEKGDAGSAESVPIQAGAIKIGNFCIIKGQACRVMDLITVKPGKSTAYKTTIKGCDIFTGKYYEENCPTTAIVYVPNVIKTQYQVADIDEEDFVSLIQPDGSIKSQLKLPKDQQLLYQQLKSMYDLNNANSDIFYTVLSAIGKQKIISGRVEANQ